MEESFHLLTETVDGEHSDYSSAESSPALTPVPMSIAELPPQALSPVSKSQHGVSKAFTKQVILVIVSYGILA